MKLKSIAKSLVPFLIPIISYQVQAQDSKPAADLASGAVRVQDVQLTCNTPQNLKPLGNSDLRTAQEFWCTIFILGTLTQSASSLLPAVGQKVYVTYRLTVDQYLAQFKFYEALGEYQSVLNFSCSAKDDPSLSCSVVDQSK